MTLIFGQRFFQGIVMIADSRVTYYKDNKKADIAQKLFLFPKANIVGFTGDFGFVSPILAFLLRQVKNREKLSNIFILRDKAPKLIKYAYNYLISEGNEKRPVSFMIGGLDFKKPVAYKNQDGLFEYFSNVFNSILFSISSPNFIINEASISNPLLEGSGALIKDNIVNDFSKFQFDFRPDRPLSELAMLMNYALNQEIKKYKIDTVGGLYQIAVIDRFGIRFIPYQTRSDYNVNPKFLDLELTLDKNHRFIQKNLKTGEEVPLLYPPEIVNIPDPSEKIFADL